VLAKAFDQLTSQVLIFLLAYVILLIGLAYFGSEMADWLRNLLYIIPVLGVGVYVLFERQGIAKKAREKGIDVKAGVLLGQPRITAVRVTPGTSVIPENVDVAVGFAGGKAEVGGFVVESQEPESPSSRDAAYLQDLVAQLDPSNRRKLIASAQRLLDGQAKRDG
jgi:hypothetical protein